jgi:hypothetical protein
VLTDEGKDFAGAVVGKEGEALLFRRETGGMWKASQQQRHYAQLSPSYVVGMVHANMPTLGIVEKRNVVALVSKSHA